MDDELLPFYEREREYLQDLAASFADAETITATSLPASTSRTRARAAACGGSSAAIA